MSTKTTDSLTFETLIGLFNLRGLYTLSFSFIFGMTLWASFIGGVITHRVLPQRQFGPLQQRLLPVYFKLNTLISSGLLLAWVRNHSAVTAHLAYPTVPDVSQAYALFIVVAMQALNLFWFGPTTSKLLTERLELEKTEGKNAQDADASPDLKALKAKFARLHGFSSRGCMGLVRWLTSLRSLRWHFTGYGLGIMGSPPNEVQPTGRGMFGEGSVYIVIW